MSDSRRLLQFGPVLAATVVIAGLGIVLPLYLAYEADRDAPAEIDISADQDDVENGASVNGAHASSSLTTANTEAAVTDPFDEEPSRSVAAEPEREPIRQLASESNGADDEIPNFDSDRTSWEAPFDPACWKATGWSFDSSGMQSEGKESTATFRRAYTRFMFECRIEPQSDTEGPLLVRLKRTQASSGMTLMIDGDRLTVTDETRTPAAVIKEETVSPAAAEGEPARLKLAATGNRLIVSWNGTVALTCNQIAGQSGRPIQFEFSSPRTPWLIRELRIEGE
jgi:hypothetical protein